MSFSVYAHAQITCDAPECTAPYPTKDGPTATLDVTAINVREAKKMIKDIARRTRWQKITDNNGRVTWRCPYDRIT